jgi:hypothetical protein
MINEPVPDCPKCNKADKSYKVSLLYLEGSAYINHQKTGQSLELDGVIKEYMPEGVNRVAEEQFVVRLVKLLSPPSGEKQVIRLIHPDGMVGLFVIISFIMLYQAFSSQPDSLPILVILLAASFTAYLIFRRVIVSRYNQKINQGQQEVIKIEKAVSRWMRLYFCARDQGVYDPVSDQFISLETIQDFLHQG